MCTCIKGNCSKMTYLGKITYLLFFLFFKYCRLINYSYVLKSIGTSLYFLFIQKEIVNTIVRNLLRLFLVIIHVSFISMITCMKHKVSSRNICNIAPLSYITLSMISPNNNTADQNQYNYCLVARCQSYKQLD